MELRKKDAIRIQHMIDACLKTQQFISHKTRTDLDKDEQLSYALVRLIEIIGEAAVKVTPETKERYSSIVWKDIIGTRNRLIHGYDDVNLDIVWQIVSVDIEELVAQLQEILKELNIRQQLF